MKNLKKALAMLLVLCMLFATACGKTPSGNESKPVDGTTASGENNAVDGEATYTYNIATPAFPTNWNPHIYQTATDSDYMLTYIVRGFYTFDYNETLDGYQMVPDMAVGDPVDVTAEYAEQYGIDPTSTGRVWKLTLQDDIKWEDGTPITAQDFVKSAELLLNPQAQNYRADNLYSGSLALVNAKNYAYSGQHVYVDPMIVDPGTDEYADPAAFEVNDEGVIVVNGCDLAIKINDDTTWGAVIGDYLEAFVQDGVDLYETLIAPNEDADGLVKVTPEIYDALCAWVATMQGASSVEEYAAAAGDYAYQEAQELCFLGKTYEEMSFDQVGITAPSDNELVLALEKPLGGFYLLYALTDSWLVNEPLYTSCEKLNNGVYTNTYGTSKDNTISYGPYKLRSFQADKQIILDKNDQYPFKEGQYQTTTIQIDYVEEASARLEMLLNGTIDSYGLGAEDMETYASSDYTYYATGTSTFFIALNPNLDALTANQAMLGADYNKTILTVKEFRQALSYALDRAAFCLATAPTNNVTLGLFSDLIISDPDNGTAYRTTDEAKQVLLKFWGLADEVGAGKMYETVDDAIASITGYNLELAREKFNEAYDIAVSEGLMDDNDVVQILIGLPNSSSNFYNKGYDFLVNCYTEAVKGTKLEGKLTFARNDTLGNGFADALRSNQVDMLFGVGWSGAALDPYSLIEAYTGANYRYNLGWDAEHTNLTVNFDGKDYTATVWEWTQALGGAEIEIKDADGNKTSWVGGSSDNVPEQRFQVLCALENAILETYDMIPVMDNSAANLKGMQIEYYSEEYVYAMGFGGVQYYTYNYSDAEWADFVASQGGSLNYN